MELRVHIWRHTTLPQVPPGTCTPGPSLALLPARRETVHTGHPAALGLRLHVALAIFLSKSYILMK